MLQVLFLRVSAALMVPGTELESLFILCNNPWRKRCVKMLGFLQKIGKSLMLPIAVMPAAALLLRLGQDDLLGIPFISAAGNAVF